MLLIPPRDFKRHEYAINRSESLEHIPRLYVHRSSLRASFNESTTISKVSPLPCPLRESLLFILHISASCYTAPGPAARVASNTKPESQSNRRSSAPLQVPVPYTEHTPCGVISPLSVQLRPHQTQLLGATSVPLPGPKSVLCLWFHQGWPNVDASRPKHIFANGAFCSQTSYKITPDPPLGLV